MKVENVSNRFHKELPQVKNSPFTTPITPKNNEQVRLSGCEIPFGAIYGVKPIKNVLDKKLQILQKLELMLAERNKYSHDTVFREAREKHEKDMKRLLKKLIQEEYNKKDLIIEFEDGFSFRDNVKSFALSFIEDHIGVLLPKIQRIADDADLLLKQRKEADTLDYELLSKLHSTLGGDDLNLIAAYRKYYEKLTSMTKLSDVHKTYPKIKLPQSPQNVAGKKIVNTFPKDFFVRYDELIENGLKKDANQLLQDTFESIIKMISKESGADLDFLRSKLLKSTNKAFLTTYHKLKASHGFASYPEHRKIKSPIISKTDIDLLSIDYDKFVLQVLQKQYLEGARLSDIKYTEGNRTVVPASLPAEYKFEKPDNKVKSILRMADDLRKEETAYDRFNVDQFKNRLKHFFSCDFSNSEPILNRIIDFESAKFVEGDRQPLIKFLRVLDDLSENKISIEEAEKIINQENLRPLGSDLINAAEKEKNLQKLKEEQKIASEFTKYSRKYDNAIDSLFRANLEEVATLCISHKPKSIEDSREISDKILKIISEYTKKEGITEPAKLEKTLKNLNEFYHYKTFYPDNPQLKIAIKFATMPDGTLNEAKAGQYLFCSDIVEKYPASSGFFTGADNKIFTTIMQKSPDNQSAILNLIKFDDYKMLNEKERLRLSSILTHFDINSASEKEIIQSLVENVYVKNPTTIVTSLNKDGAQTIESVMMPSAKESIMEDKPYPICLKYFQAFEKSMGRVGQSKEEDGIQIIGTNNKTLRKMYKQEVKIPMEERLYSTQGNYVFDVYKSGLHKLKNSKA